MPSTATTRNRLEKQATGENTNTWGSKLNATAFDLIDAALDGRTAFTLSGTKTLSSTNFAADEARARFLDITGGTGGTVTIPAVEKWYLVRNKTSGNVIFTTGGATTATVPTNQIQFVVTDGTSVYADTTATAAAASAAAAAASAASINDANLVHIAGAETITGVKTFSGGISGMAIGTNIQAHSGVLDSLAGLTLTGNGLKNVRVNSAGNGLELAAASNTAIVSANKNATTGSGTPTSTGATVTFTDGKTNTLTIRGIYTSTSTATGLGLSLFGTGTTQVSGRVRIWSSLTAFTDFLFVSNGSGILQTFSGANAAATATAYGFEVTASVTNVSGANLTLSIYNTNATGTVTLLANASVIAQAVD